MISINSFSFTDKVTQTNYLQKTEQIIILKSSIYTSLIFSINVFILGGPAEKCGMLKVKDEILMVNNQDITEMRHSEAWTHLKFLDEGPVHILIRRKVQQSNE